MNLWDMLFWSLQKSGKDEDMKFELLSWKYKGQHRHGWYKNVEKHQGTYKVNGIVVSYPWVCVYCHSRVSQSNLPPLWGCTASFNPNDS